MSNNAQYIHPSLLPGLTILEDGDKIIIPLSGEKADALARILYLNKEQKKDTAS